VRKAGDPRPTGVIALETCARGWVSLYSAASTPAIAIAALPLIRAIIFGASTVSVMRLL
jgi:hypothetical protein